LLFLFVLVTDVGITPGESPGHERPGLARGCRLVVVVDFLESLDLQRCRILRNATGQTPARSPERRLR